MEANEKKLAAAVAAVMTYIQTEEEALVMPPPQPRKRTFEQGNLWAMAGRQGMMQMSNLMQMKTFNRLR